MWPSFYGEMFATRVRFSGLAIGTQLGFLVAGFAPAIVTALGGVEEGGWVVNTVGFAGPQQRYTLAVMNALGDEGGYDDGITTTTELSRILLGPGN